MSHIFISYAHSDSEYARRLADHLIANGFDVWIDDRIDFGSRWVRAIFEALDSCAAFIVIMTPRSYESEFVEKEFLHAANLKKPTFPLLFEGRAFPYFVGIQYYDVQDGALPSQDFMEDLARFAPSSGQGHDVATNATKVIQHAPSPDATGEYLTTPKEQAESHSPPPAASVSESDENPANAPKGSAQRSRGSLLLAAGAVLIALVVILPLALTLRGELNPESAATMMTDGNGVTTSPPTAIGGGRGEIVFVSDRDGNSEIYVMNIDGSNPRNLTNSPAADSYPDWSPDGIQIVFMSATEDGNTIINIMDADGGNVHQLGDRYGWHPAWSPDGGQIAFADSEINSVEIFVVEPDGSNLRALTDDSASDGYPAWSPDGTQIAFITDRDGDDLIHIMDADGGNIHTLTDEPERPLNLAWSPDGERIAFQATENANTFLYVIDADGSNFQRLTHDLEDGYEPAWSPDGTQIAFMSYREENGAELYIMDTKSGIVRQIVESPAVEEYPAWRP